MHCTNCDYPLWELRARQCPECGEPFAPSRYRFVADSVRFNCPHCGQTYYGTGEEGHLEPPSFNCVSCTRPVSMDEMVLLPAEGVTERQTRATTVPWVDPGRGFFSRWFGTIGMVLVSPVQLIRALPRDASAWSALRFALLTNFLYLMIGGGVFMVVPLMMGIAFGGGGGGGPGLVALLVLGAIFFVCPFLLLVGGIMLWATLAHLVLRATGPTDGPWGRTLTSVGYASAANILCAIPCLGFYFVAVSWIWWGVNAALMLRESQRVSGPRAAAAAFVPAVLMVVAVSTGMVVMFMSLQSSLAAAQAAAQATLAQAAGSSQTQAMLSSLRSYAGVNGDAPPHALALVPDQGLGAANFYIGAAPLMMGGPHWIDALAAMPADQQAAAIDGAAASLPEGTVAHRVGEFVFTYHGIDLGPWTAADGGLWVVVGLPPPGFAVPGQPSVILAASLDGMVTPIAVHAITEALAAQNALRAAAGLAPLPDPMSVTEGTPEVADTDG